MILDVAGSSPVGRPNRSHSTAPEPSVRDLKPRDDLALLTCAEMARADAAAIAGGVPGVDLMYHALLEFRPHRPPLGPEQAAGVLRSEVAAGRIDADAADAVLQAAGHRVARRRDAGSLGLTEREIQVLRLLARGLSTRAIAVQLVISPKTAGSHIEHIYTKTGAANRAQASVYALKHGLMHDI